MCVCCVSKKKVCERERERDREREYTGESVCVRMHAYVCVVMHACKQACFSPTYIIIQSFFFTGAAKSVIYSYEKLKKMINSLR